jgi:tetratricopeptide (TPR) repeat protein
MREEAMAAYREALALWPASLESLYPLLEFLWEDGRYDEARELIDAAFVDDPENEVIIRIAVINEQRREYGGQVRELRTTLEKDPTNAEALTELLAIYANLGETNHMEEFLDRAVADFHDQGKPLRMLANYTEMIGMKDRHLAAVRALAAAEPRDASARFLLARALARAGETNAAAAEAEEAVKLGGRRMRDAIMDDPEFSKLIENGALGPLFGPRSGALNTP